LGLLKVGSALILGFNSFELRDGRKAVEKANNLDKLNTSDINSLKSSSEYSGRKTVMVMQDEAKIMSYGSMGVDGLYTFGAAPCSIVIAVSKNSSDAIQNVGMAHVDALIPKEQIMQYLNRVRQTSENLEVYVLSGTKELSLRIIESCEQSGAQIKFFCADFWGKRSDAAIVSSTGVVYYGMRDDLKGMLDMKKVEMLKLKTLTRSAINLSIENVGF
jgi:hypothetical protein